VTWPLVVFAVLAAAPAWTGSSAGLSAEVSPQGLICFAEGRTSPCVQTVSARRGTKRLDSSLRRFSSTPFAVTLERASYAETLGVGAGGFEQAFHFADPPAGTGALVLELATFRATPAPRGRFVELGTLRYGEATWIDAAGKSSAVALTVRGSRLVLTVPAQTLETTTWPAVLDPSISSEGAVGDLSHGAPDGVWDPSVAWTGSHFLTVFAEPRNGLTASLYGSRVGRDGTHVDTFSFLVAGGFVELGEPSVACGAGVCVVAYLRVTGTDHDVFLSRVTPSGQALDLQGVPVATGTGQQDSPHVVFNGTDFAVFFTDDRLSPGNARLAAAHVSATAVATSTPLVTPANGLAVDVGTASLRDPGVTFDGTGGYVVAWADFRSSSQWTPYAARISAAFANLDPGGVPLSTTVADAAHLSLGTAADMTFVAWDAATGTVGRRRVEGVRFSGGVVIDAAPIPLGDPAHSRVRPVVVAEPGLFEIFFVDDTGSAGRVARVQPSGTVAVQDDGVGFSSYALSSATGAWSGGSRFAATTSGSLLQYDLVGDAGVDQDHQFADGTSRQWSPSAVWAGTNWVLTWLDWDQSFLRVMSAPVDADGGMGSATELGREYFIDSMNTAFAGDAGLLVYGAYGGVMGVRIDRQGKSLDTAPFPIVSSGTARMPAVAASGTDFLVTWADDRLTQYDHDLFAARVSTGGVVSPVDGAPLVVRPGLQDQPAVAWDGTRYLVAWVDEGALRAGALMGSGLTVDGGVELSPGASAGPALAGGAGGALLAWSDESGGSPDLRMVLLSPGPVQLPSGGVSTLSARPGAQRSVRLSGDGTGYLATWEDLARSPPQADVWAVKLDPLLAAAEPAFALSQGTHHQSPGSALDGRGHALLAYGRYTEAPPVTSIRLYTRTLGVPGSNGVPCGAGADCASGFCVDGVCCDGACAGGSGDCQACAVSAGAARDGACGPLGVGQTCRPNLSVCDAPEVCDGVSVSCPADVVAPDGTLCGFGRCTAGACLLSDGGNASTGGGAGGGAGGGSGGGTGGGLAFTTQPSATGSCNVPWRYAPTTDATGAVSFGVRGADGNALPDALFQNPANGALFWQPAGAGHFVFELVASSRGETAVQRVEVEVSCVPYKVGCGCSVESGPLFALLGLGLLGRRRR
jgi:MYXO-CTERM domain-containing protein